MNEALKETPSKNGEAVVEALLMQMFCVTNLRFRARKMRFSLFIKKN